MSFVLFQDFDWELFAGYMLNYISVMMICAVYLYLMYQWVIRGKAGTQDSDET